MTVSEERHKGQFPNMYCAAPFILCNPPRGPGGLGVQFRIFLMWKDKGSREMPLGLTVL